MSIWDVGTNVLDRTLQQLSQNVVGALRYTIPSGRDSDLSFTQYVLNNASYNVKDHGALGDGVTNDVPAIQDAIDKAWAAGGGRVYFPPGTYGMLKATGQTYMLRVRPGVVLEGDGWVSRLKVLDAAGNFSMIFYSNEPLEQNSFRWFVVDMNPTGNTGANIRNEISGQEQWGFHLWSGADVIEFDHVSADPCCGTNFISVGDADPDSGRVTVKGGYYRHVKGPTNAPLGYVDSSTIYLDCDQQEVSGNTFVTTLADDAFGAIEVHGGRAVVALNTCTGFETLVNVVTRPIGTDFEESNIVISANTVRDCKRAVSLWCITGYALRNVAVVNNTISVNNADRGADDVHGNDNYWGIGINWGTGGDLDGELDGLTIAGNIVRFQKEDRTYTAIGSESITGGIALQHRGVCRNIRVFGNQVIDSPKMGVSVWARGTNTFERVDVHDNTITDAGNNSNENSAYRAAIFAAGKLADCSFTDIKIVDTATGGSAYGFWAVNLDNLDAASSNVEINRTMVISKTTGQALKSSGVYAQWEAIARTNAVTAVPSITPDASLGGTYVVLVINNTPFTIQNPINAGPNQRLAVVIRNNSGGVMGTITWDTAWRISAAVLPAANKQITLWFRTNGTIWQEESRSAEVPAT